MIILKWFVIILLLGTLGCEGEDRSAENAGKGIDRAKEKGADAVRDAIEKAGEQMSSKGSGGSGGDGPNDTPSEP